MKPIEVLNLLQEAKRVYINRFEAWKRKSHMKKNKLLISSTQRKLPGLTKKAAIPETPCQVFDRLMEENGYKSYNLPFAGKMFDYVQENNLCSPTLKPGDKVYIDFFNYNDSFNGWDCGGNILKCLGQEYDIAAFYKPFVIKSVGLSMKDSDKANDNIADALCGSANLNIDFATRLLNPEEKLTEYDFAFLKRASRISNTFFYQAATLEESEFPQAGGLIEETFIPVDSPLGKQMEMRFEVERKIQAALVIKQEQESKLAELRKAVESIPQILTGNELQQKYNLALT